MSVNVKNVKFGFLSKLLIFFWAGWNSTFNFSVIFALFEEIIKNERFGVKQRIRYHQKALIMRF